MVVEKKMDFVSFRRYLGAGPLQLDAMMPQPGVIYGIIRDLSTFPA